MAILTGLRRLADGAIAIAAVIVTLALLGIVAAEALLRNFNQSQSWSQELAQYLLVWLGFLGWIIASRRRSHIRITVLIDRLPGRARRCAEIAIQLAIIVLAAVLFWKGLVLIERNLDVGSASLPLPTAIQYVMLPVLGVVLVAQALVEIAIALRGDVAAPSSREGQAT